MDTSREYIKMCEAAVEIQELWKPEDGDFYSNHDLIEISHCCLCADEDDMGTTEATTGDIWLPRQDQLQKMLYNDYNCFGIRIKNLLEDFSEWAIQDKHFNSFEQLWLAFVMWEKFHKYYYVKGWAFKDAGES